MLASSLESRTVDSSPRRHGRSDRTVPRMPSGPRLLLNGFRSKLGSHYFPRLLFPSHTQLLHKFTRGKKGREKFDLSLDSLSRGRGESDAAAAHHKPKLFFLVGRMEFERKPLSLLELCIRTVIDNLRYVGSMDGVELQLLKRILPHCTLDQLTRIESRTEMDLSPVTDVLWKRFYQRQFGEENVNHVVKKMKQSGVHYKWKDLFKAKTEKQKEVEDKMVEKLTKKYQAEKAEKQSKQIKLCTKVPPSSKRSFFGGSGPSNLSNYKSPMLKKARMEVNSRAKMQSAIQRNNLARSSQPTRMTSPHGQPMRTTTIHRPNSTITITKPTSSNRPIQNSRLKF